MVADHQGRQYQRAVMLGHFLLSLLKLERIHSRPAGYLWLADTPCARGRC